MTLAIRAEVESGRATYVTDRPIVVRLTFYTPYAPTHLWSGDLDKLERNAFDAMTLTIVGDDRYIVSKASAKVAAEGTPHGPGVMIEAWEVVTG